MYRISAALLVLGIISASCGETRPPEAARAPLAATYVQQIKPLLNRRCAPCHRGAQPAGGYDLSSYPGLLGPGTDLTRNAIPGDAASRLLSKLDATREPKHWAHLLPATAELNDGETPQQRRAADLELLRTWVVTAKLAYFDVTVHPPTWVYPGDRNSKSFHGGVLRAGGWNLEACKGCHGSDLQGGTAKRSCTSCHHQGPMGCTTCHGSSSRDGLAASAPPGDLSWNLSPTARGVGAHQLHLRARSWWATIGCDDCHVVPSTAGARGHLTDGTTSTSDLRAELSFGSRARQRGVTPSHDSKTGVCSVYCHGASFTGQGTDPGWTSARTTPAACNSCHKVPALFGGLDCANCHPQSVTRCTPGTKDCLSPGKGVGTKFIRASLHGDGLYPLGLAGQEHTCYGCHGTKSSAGAPAPDLRGNSSISAVTVGLHQAHLTTGTYRQALPCGTCHVVPKTLKDKGHFDDDVPAEVVFSTLASGKLRGAGIDLKPTWDRSSATCSKTYCHALDGAKVSSWKWTSKLAAGLACDSCHGLPPKQTISGKAHPAGSDCKVCHSSAYTSKGTLDPARHINGKVD